MRVQADSAESMPPTPMRGIAPPVALRKSRSRAGANLVQIYSAMVYEGPFLARRIVRGLPALMRRDGFATIAEAVGSA